MNQPQPLERADRERRITRIRHSEDIGWRGVQAAFYNAGAGFCEGLSSWPFIVMHVDAPIISSVRCDAAYGQQLQQPGDVMVFPADSMHAWETAGDAKMISVTFTPELTESVCSDLGLNAQQRRISPELYLSDKRVSPLLWAILEELRNEERSGRIYAESLGHAMFAHLLQLHPTSEIFRRTNGLPRRRLKRVLDYIHEHLGHDISLFDVARTADVSISHLKVLFKQSTGTPVHQYVMRARTEKAVELLRNTTLIMSDVAHQTGFANQSHLAKCVRRFFGVAPAELRRQSQ